VKSNWLSRNKGERKWLRVEADVRGAGTRDEPLRMSAWELLFKMAIKKIISLGETFLLFRSSDKYILNILGDTCYNSGGSL